MKKQFDKKILYIILIIAVLIGIILSRVDGFIGKYAVYEAIALFCVCLFVYSLILKKYDGKEEVDDDGKEKENFLSKRSLLLSSEEIEKATSSQDGENEDRR